MRAFLSATMYMRAAALWIVLLTAPLDAGDDGNKPLELESLFAGSNCLLDKRGRELLADGGGQLDAVVNLKRFTLTHCDLVIQQYFSADALAGLDRALTYARRIGSDDQFGRRYRTLSGRQAAVTVELTDLSQRYQTVFPFVVQAPINRPAHDMAHFEDGYKGSTDFVSVTGRMLDRIKALLDESRSIEIVTRRHLQALGGGGGPDWAPGGKLRTETSPRRQARVVNFDDSGRPTNIIVGSAYGGSPNGPQHIALLEKFTADFIVQQYTFNRMDVNGDIANRTLRYGKH